MSHTVHAQISHNGAGIVILLQKLWGSEEEVLKNLLNGKFEVVLTSERASSGSRHVTIAIHPADTVGRV